MTTSAVSGVNCMGDGMVKIEVINMASLTNRTGTYVMKVPFSSLSRTMQFIHRSGGKITNVTKLASSEQLASTSSQPTQPDAPAPTATPVVEPQLAQSTPKATQSNNTNNRQNNKRGGKNKR